MRVRSEIEACVDFCRGPRSTPWQSTGGGFEPRACCRAGGSPVAGQLSGTLISVPACFRVWVAGILTLKFTGFSRNWIPETVILGKLG